MVDFYFVPRGREIFFFFISGGYFLSTLAKFGYNLHCVYGCLWEFTRALLTFSRALFAFRGGGGGGEIAPSPRVCFTLPRGTVYVIKYCILDQLSVIFIHEYR